MASLCHKSPSGSSHPDLDKVLMQPGFYLAPTANLIDETPAANGSYTLNMTGLTIPVAGIVYVNVTGADCNPAPLYPSGASLPASLTCTLLPS